MSAEATAPTETRPTLLDAASLSGLDALERIATGLAPGREVSAGNLWGSSQALALAALAARPEIEGTLLAVLSTEGEAELFAEDLAAFGLEPTPFPAREPGASRGVGAVAGAAGLRARLLCAQRLAGAPADRPRVIVASVHSLLQPLPSLRQLEREFLRLERGQVLDRDRLLQDLVRKGYQRTPLAEAPGEISLRGDIFDVFPFAGELPLRIELLGDEIESLRSYGPTDQRSIDTFDEVEVCLVAGGDPRGEGTLLSELLAPDAVAVTIEPLRVDERAEKLRIQLPAHERALRKLRSSHHALRRLSLQSLPGRDVAFETRSVTSLEVGMRRAEEALRRAGADGSRVLLACQTEAERERLSTILPGDLPGLELCLGSVAVGFRLPAARLVIVNHRELKGVTGARRRTAPSPVSYRSRAIQSFFELKPGDLVVHAVHGLSRFVGLERLQRGGGEQDHLHLVFAGDVSLFVPGSRIDMVQRYIGSSSGVSLDRIGGGAFRRRKEKVQRGLFDLASELIEVQARRALHERPSWSADDELVREMIESFPYDDTPDQARADREIQADVLGPRPMDRLLCGDVGFGKTEIAVRAAFRVVSGGGQVAVLVPTTVLAHQHHETFAERLADFPVEVAVVSRAVPPADVRKTLERVESGEIDVLIGTHRILSKDVRFKRLGLLIVDEEQRFGVQHKEHFKKLRASVDLLTLTATPIPRTLHMSLSGIRDISALTVPPPGRQEIETAVAYGDDDDLIREAILRETNRGGQVFFLHNRVASIDALARRLSRLVPSASLIVGHGQMGGRELEDVMDRFTAGEYDVLVATTIIENGLDIPAAGTILIDQADRFGLSELHQLRGRVGRGSRKAYCYLLVDRGRPLSDIARARLKALEEMNRLGAGFDISIKDLELRGAGNVLGAEQSGHIAAVGYDMYCRLLRLTIERLASGESDAAVDPHEEELEAGAEVELGMPAFLPEEWIPSQDARLEILRELARIRSDDDTRVAREMLRDRFGRIPAPAENLLRLFRVKARLDPHRLTRIGWTGDVWVVQYEDPVALERLFAGRRVDLRRIRSGVAHLVPPPRHAQSAEAALRWLERHTRPADSGARDEPAAGDA